MNSLLKLFERFEASLSDYRRDMINRINGPAAFMAETRWFERHSKLSPDEAADLEASTYGRRKVRA